MSEEAFYLEAAMELTRLIGYDWRLPATGAWGTCPECGSDECSCIGWFGLSCNVCGMSLDVLDALEIYGDWNGKVPYVGRGGVVLHDPAEARLDFIHRILRRGDGYLPGYDPEPPGSTHTPQPR